MKKGLLTFEILWNIDNYCDGQLGDKFPFLLPPFFYPIHTY